MYRTSRLLALFLVLSLLMGSQSVQAMPVPMSHSGHPAGCHGPVPVRPSPARSDYKCCMSGHQWAVPIGSFSPDSPIGSLMVPAVHHPLPERIVDRSATQLLLPSNSPPSAAPLRI